MTSAAWKARRKKYGPSGLSGKGKVHIVEAMLKTMIKKGKKSGARGAETRRANHVPITLPKINFGEE